MCQHKKFVVQCQKVRYPKSREIKTTSALTPYTRKSDKNINWAQFGRKLQRVMQTIMIFGANANVFVCVLSSSSIFFFPPLVYICLVLNLRRWSKVGSVACFGKRASIKSLVWSVVFVFCKHIQHAKCETKQISCSNTLQTTKPLHFDSMCVCECFCLYSRWLSQF